MATHSSILAWRIPGTEEPGGLPSVRSNRVDTTEATWQQQQQQPPLSRESLDSDVEGVLFPGCKTPALTTDLHQPVRPPGDPCAGQNLAGGLSSGAPAFVSTSRGSEQPFPSPRPLPERILRIPARGLAT